MGLSIFFPQPARADDDVRVRFDAPVGTELRWTPPDETESQVVCTAPCADRRLSRDGVYVAAPPNRSTSHAFHLEKQNGLELDVRPNRIGLVLGLIAITAGGFTLGGGISMRLQANDSKGDQNAWTNLRKPLGTFFIGAGIVELLAGTVALFLDTGTSVHQHQQTRWDTF